MTNYEKTLKDLRVFKALFLLSSGSLNLGIGVKITELTIHGELPNLDYVDGVFLMIVGIILLMWFYKCLFSIRRRWNV